MEHKYVLIKKAEANEFTLRELAETDAGIFTMLSECKFKLDQVEEAVGAGSERVIELIRSNDFFPTRFFAELLTEKIVAMFDSGSADSVTIECSDKDSLSVAVEAPPELVENEKEATEIDKLLEDEDDDHVEDEGE